MPRIQSRAGAHGVLYEVFGEFTNSDGTTSTVTYGFEVAPIPAGPVISFGAGDLAAALGAIFKPFPGTLQKPEGNNRRLVFTSDENFLYELVDIAEDGRIIAIIGYDVETRDGAIHQFSSRDLDAALEDAFTPRPVAEEVAVPENEPPAPRF